MGNPKEKGIEIKYPKPYADLEDEYDINSDEVNYEAYDQQLAILHKKEAQDMIQYCKNSVSEE